MTEKSILEQALLQVQTLEEAVKSNAKGILASTMKQELNELLKESLEEEEEEEIVPEEEEETIPEEEEDVTNDDETSDDDDETSDDDMSDEDMSNVDDEDALPKNIDSMDDDMSTGDDSSMDSMADDTVRDMTNDTPENVLKVFKSMKPEDGIIIKKDNNHIELETGDDDYIIKLDEEEETSGMQDEMSEEDWSMSEEDDLSEEEDTISPEEEETIYEIELDEESSEEEEEEESSEEEEESKEGEQTESARTIGNGYHAGIKSKKKYFAGNKRDEINEEVSKLKKQNAEYKKALVLFKDKLNEVAVFNANLAYATRIFTEHSTTKQEKLNILKRFDSVSTMNESKTLFNTIRAELGTKKPVTESVVNKIASTPSSSSTEILSESKAYENPQFKRMKDLMGKIK